MPGPNKNFGDINADKVGSETNPMEEMNAKSVNSKSISGDVLSIGDLTFSLELVTDNALGSDIDIIHKRYFDDGKYRVFDSNNNNTLYTTTDFESFNAIATGIASGTIADHVVLPDGTFAVYTSNDDSTGLYTGSSLTNLTNSGTVVNEPDCGVFLEDGTVHIFSEDADTGGAIDSEIISHFTTPTSDLLNATQQSDAIDNTSRNWVLGDVDVIEIGGMYYMFTDRKYPSEGTYYIALWESSDLYNWTLVTDTLSNIPAGDFVVTEYGNGYIGMSEFTGEQGAGGVWRVYATPRNLSGLRNIQTEELTVHKQASLPSEWSEGVANSKVKGRRAHWGLEAFSGNTVFDSSPYRNDGTINGPNWEFDDEQGVYLDFTVNSDYVEVPDSSELNFGTNSFSLEAWLYNYNNDDNYPIAKGARDTSVPGYAIRMFPGTNGTAYKFEISDGSSFRSAYNQNARGEMDTETWHHVVGVRDTSSETLSVFVDGVFMADRNDPLGSIDTSSALRFGENSDGTRPWKGRMGSVRLFPKALSEDEIKALYWWGGREPTGHL